MTRLLLIYVVYHLSQIIEHRDGRFQAVGWVILPIFAHTEPLQFVNKSLRSEVAMRPGIPDSTQLSADLELQSVLSGDEDLPLLVVEVCPENTIKGGSVYIILVWKDISLERLNVVLMAVLDQNTQHCPRRVSTLQSESLKIEVCSL